MKISDKLSGEVFDAISKHDFVGKLIDILPLEPSKGSMSFTLKVTMLCKLCGIGLDEEKDLSAVMVLMTRFGLIDIDGTDPSDPSFSWSGQTEPQTKALIKERIQEADRIGRGGKKKEEPSIDEAVKGEVVHLETLH